nr:hypothetical protein C1892_10905 [Pseudomonas sp. MPBD7-1]
MARELAPAWVRSAHKKGAAAQPSGSKLPRHGFNRFKERYGLQADVLPKARYNPGLVVFMT